jgi:hypothetical protein
MLVTLLLPGILLPSDAVQAFADPLHSMALPSLLARARPAGDAAYSEPAHLGWLAEHVFGHAPPAATAPYAFAALSGTTPSADECLWHADPVHLEVSRDHLVVMPPSTPMDDEDVNALFDSVQALAADAGAGFVRAGDRWFLRARRRWDLRPAPLAAVLGEPLYEAMPEGGDAPVWNRLLNSIQMTWHAHAVNQAREARGEATINSIWLHGGGTWAPLPPLAYSAIHGESPELRGAATAAGVPSSPLADDPRDGALMVWPDARDARPAHGRANWIAALAQVDARIAALARLSDLDVVLTGQRRARRFRMRSADRWKFWRSPRLEEILSE